MGYYKCPECGSRNFPFPVRAWRNIIGPRFDGHHWLCYGVEKGVVGKGHQDGQPVILGDEDYFLDEPEIDHATADGVESTRRLEMKNDTLHERIFLLEQDIEKRKKRVSNIGLCCFILLLILMWFLGCPTGKDEWQ